MDIAITSWQLALGTTGFMLTHRRRRAALAALAFMGHGGMAPPAKQVSSLCVKPVEVVRSDLQGPGSEAQGPSEFVYANAALTPLAISKVHGPGDPQAYPRKRVLWRWGTDGRFHGPEALVGFEPKGTDGRFTYLEQRDTPRAAAARVSENVPVINSGTVSRVFALDNGGAPKEILLPPASGAALRYTIAPARNGFGPILLSERPDPELPERALQERWSASGTRLGRFIGYKDFRYNFSRAGLEIAADGNALDITDLLTNTRLTAAVPNRDGFGGIESLTLDRFGWLFVENGGADYALKLARDSDRLRVDHVVEFTGRGWLSRLLSFFFGADAGVRIDERHFSPQCVDQSAVLRLTFFCKPFRVLRDGVLEEVNKLPDTTERWIGDATGAGVALVAGRPGGLYATDGYGAQRISDLKFYASAIQDVPEARRTFVASEKQVWELVGSYPRLGLRRINFSRADGQEAPYHCCLSNFGSAKVRFVALPGTSDVLAFHSTLGVWLLGRRDAKMLWGADRSAIDLNSVARADAWKGLVFLTEDRTPYVLKSCPVVTG